MIKSTTPADAEVSSIKPWGAPITSDSTLAQYKSTDWGRWQIPQLYADFTMTDCDQTGCLCHKPKYFESVMQQICQATQCQDIICQVSACSCYV